MASAIVKGAKGEAAATRAAVAPIPTRVCDTRGQETPHPPAGRSVGRLVEPSEPFGGRRPVPRDWDDLSPRRAC
jgi:hypothetical protein